MRERERETEDEAMLKKVSKQERKKEKDIKLRKEKKKERLRKHEVKKKAESDLNAPETFFIQQYPKLQPSSWFLVQERAILGWAHVLVESAWVKRSQNQVETPLSVSS